MGVIIDEINADVESGARQTEEPPAQSAETPQSAKAAELRRMMRQLEQRKMRLKAD